MAAALLAARGERRSWDQLDAARGEALGPMGGLLDGDRIGEAGAQRLARPRRLGFQRGQLRLDGRAIELLVDDPVRGRPRDAAADAGRRTIVDEGEAALTKLAL